MDRPHNLLVEGFHLDGLRHLQVKGFHLDRPRHLLVQGFHLGCPHNLLVQFFHLDGATLSASSGLSFGSATSSTKIIKRWVIRRGAHLSRKDDVHDCINTALEWFHSCPLCKLGLSLCHALVEVPCVNKLYRTSKRPWRRPVEANKRRE